MCRDRDKDRDRDRVRDKNGLTEAEFLARYDAGKYPRPSVTADVAAFTHTDGRPRVLLVRRGGHPFIGTWALPGGFVEPETGIENAPVRQIGTYSDPHRDPRTRVITVAFYSCLDGLPAQPKAGDDAAEAGFFTIDCTPRRENGGEWLDFVLEGCGETLRFAVRVIPAPGGFPGDVAYEPDGFRVLASDHEALLARAFAEDAKRG